MVDSTNVLARILSVFRRQPPPPPVVELVSPQPQDPLPLSKAAKSSNSNPSNPTISDILRDQVEALGGPSVEGDRRQWMVLAERVAALAVDVPAPPSFPAIAGQVLAMVRKSQLDLNELVGAVQRDAAIAGAILRIANSAAFSPTAAITSLRGAIQALGTWQVVEVVMGTSGRSYYQVASRAELELFPELWRQMFDDAMANAFTSGRMALDIPNARSERALLAGLLSDVGRPIALRIIAGLITDGMERPDDAFVLAVLDEVAPSIGARAVAAMNLPADVSAACIPDAANPCRDSHIAQLVSAIAAIQRRSPRIYVNAAAAREHAEALALKPLLVRTLFAQRSAYVQQAAEMFR